MGGLVGAAFDVVHQLLYDRRNQPTDAAAMVVAIVYSGRVAGTVDHAADTGPRTGGHRRPITGEVLRKDVNLGTNALVLAGSFGNDRSSLPLQLVTLSSHPRPSRLLVGVGRAPAFSTICSSSCYLVGSRWLSGDASVSSV